MRQKALRSVRQNQIKQGPPGKSDSSCFGSFVKVDTIETEFQKPKVAETNPCTNNQKFATNLPLLCH